MRSPRQWVLGWCSSLRGLVPRTLLLTFLILRCGSVDAQDRAFDFALIGDMPYTKVQEREYSARARVLNAADLAFVAHIGDFQFDARPYNQNPSLASMPCVDENYKAIRDSFQTVRHPFILTPGDNDWTDCWPLQARKVDPLELLAKLRTMFFPEGRSLGQRPMAVSNQSADPQFAKFRENLRWSTGRRDLRHSAHRRQQRQFRPHAADGCRASASARPPISPGSSRRSRRPRRTTAAAS